MKNAQSLVYRGFSNESLLVDKHETAYSIIASDSLDDTKNDVSISITVIDGLYNELLPIPHRMKCDSREQMKNLDFNLYANKTKLDSLWPELCGFELRNPSFDSFVTK